MLDKSRIFCYKNQAEEIDLSVYFPIYNYNQPNSFVLKPSEEDLKPIEFTANSAIDAKQWVKQIQSAQSEPSPIPKPAPSPTLSPKPLINSRKSSMGIIQHKFRRKSSPNPNSNSKSNSNNDSSKLQESKQIITDLQSKLMKKDEIIGTLQISLNTQTSNVNKLESEIKHKSEEMSKLNTNIEELQSNLDLVNTEKDALELREKSKDILENKKSYLISLSVIILICSLLSSLALSRSFETSDSWNGQVAIISSIISIVLTIIKCGISYRTTFVEHKPEFNGQRIGMEGIQQDRVFRQFWMKSIYVTLSTLNDCIFDVLQGFAAISGESYTNSMWKILLFGTWFGFTEELIELCIEIFFANDAFDFDVLDCKQIFWYWGLLILSGFEALAGSYLLMGYKEKGLKYSGATIEIILIIIIVICICKFNEWNNNYKNQIKQYQNENGEIDMEMEMEMEMGMGRRASMEHKKTRSFTQKQIELNNHGFEEVDDGETSDASDQD